MTTSSLCGKPDDYESRKQWTNKDWFTHVGAWENEQGQLCFGSSQAFCAMLAQFHRTHTQHIPQLVGALELVKRRLNTCLCDEVEMGEGTMNRLFEEVSEAISLAKGEKE